MCGGGGWLYYIFFFVFSSNSSFCCFEGHSVDIIIDYMRTAFPI